MFPGWMSHVLLFVVGDVSGHGVSAAMLSIYIIQRLQALLEEGVPGRYVYSFGCIGEYI